MALKNSQIQTKCFPFGHEPNGVTEWFLPLGGLRCNVFHSAKSHMSVLQWPASAPIKWTYETLLMCTHLEWCQLTEKTWRGRHLVGLRDSTQVSRHSHQKTRRTFNKLSAYLTCGTTVKTLLWLMLDDERTHGMCTYVFPSFVFFPSHCRELKPNKWEALARCHVKPLAC